MASTPWSNDFIQVGTLYVCNLAIKLQHEFETIVEIRCPKKICQCLFTYKRYSWRVLRAPDKNAVPCTEDTFGLKREEDYCHWPNSSSILFQTYFPLNFVFEAEFNIGLYKIVTKNGKENRRKGEVVPKSVGTKENNKLDKTPFSR